MSALGRDAYGPERQLIAKRTRSQNENEPVHYRASSRRDQHE